MKTETAFKRIDFLTCRTQLNKLGFTDEEINNSLDMLEITKRTLCDEKSFERPACNLSYLKIKEFTRVGVGHFTKYLKDYEKSYTANADFYLISAQYQGLNHGKIIKQLLKNKFDWFSSFTKNKNYKESETGQYFDSIGRLNVNDLPEKYKNMTVLEVIELSKNKDLIKKESGWALYEMHNESNYEMYLTTEKGSLYVPIEAILNNDWKTINERMIKYAKSYHDPINLSGFALNHRGRTKEEYKKDKENDYNKMISPLTSEEGLKLKNILTRK